MKNWRLLLAGILLGLIASGLVLLVASPVRNKPLSITPSIPDPNIVVDVDGFVFHPGVYTLKLGDRIDDAVKAAGGMIEGADSTAINLAAFIYDGQKITISGKADTNQESGDNPTSVKNLMDLNSATLDELVGLPGIGEQKAAAIIQYRISYGDFQSVDDLLYVPGIGQSLLDSIRNYVTVSK